MLSSVLWLAQSNTLCSCPLSLLYTSITPFNYCFLQYRCYFLSVYTISRVGYHLKVFSSSAELWCREQNIILIDALPSGESAKLHAFVFYYLIWGRIYWQVLVFSSFCYARILFCTQNVQSSHKRHHFTSVWMLEEEREGKTEGGSLPCQPFSSLVHSLHLPVLAL